MHRVSAEIFDSRYVREDATLDDVEDEFYDVDENWQNTYDVERNGRFSDLIPAIGGDRDQLYVTADNVEATFTSGSDERVQASIDLVNPERSYEDAVAALTDDDTALVDYVVHTFADN